MHPEVAARYGFALAGGHAVNAHGFLIRPSADVDLFTSLDEDLGSGQRRAPMGQSTDRRGHGGCDCHTAAAPRDRFVGERSKLRCPAARPATPARPCPPGVADHGRAHRPKRLAGQRRGHAAATDTGLPACSAQPGNQYPSQASARCAPHTASGGRGRVPDGLGPHRPPRPTTCPREPRSQCAALRR